MANNYCESSSWLPLTKDQVKLAQVIIDRVAKELEENEDGYCGVEIDIEQQSENNIGIWFRHDESINVEHLEAIARALIEELNIEKPFYCSWSYTCSKPRIDEFGGGAFAIIKGKDTIWVDAMTHVMNEAEHLMKKT